MIYLDTSVVLAELFVENVRLNSAVYKEPLISSRLLEYEVWNRIHAKGIKSDAREYVSRILQSISLVELSPLVLQRALEPFPKPVRTLDALHLSTLLYLREQRISLRLASFDRHMIVAARALKIEILS